jgi:Tfp pilus assembly protein PilF
LLIATMSAIMLDSLLDRAVAVLHKAEAEPRRAVAPARQLVRMARHDHDYAAASIAERALGIAALHLQDTEEAARHLRTAAALGRRAGAPDLVAEARLRLAAVLNVGGQHAAALRSINAALAQAVGADRARAWAQRGAILLQVGRLDAAHLSFEAALPGLRAVDDRMWLKRVLSNRGLIHARRNRFAAAEADLQEALALNRDLGIELSVAFIEQNLGWVNTLRGDVPRALDHLDRAEQTLRRLGAEIGFLLEDRATLLLSVGLDSEARVVAEEAVAAFERERRRILVPGARLLLAQALIFDGDAHSALSEARRAAREFAGQQRPEGLAQARLVIAVCRAAGPDRARVDLRALPAIAEVLEAGGSPLAAIEARLLAAELAAERGHGDRGRSELVVAARARHRGPAATRAVAWQAEAELRLRDGRVGGALRALASGLRVLDTHRAGLGASELRAHAGRTRIALAARGLGLAVEGRRLDRILAWAEHGRASHLLLPPLLPPPDEGLAAALAEMRSAEAAVEEAIAQTGDPATALRRQMTAERQVRDHSRRQQAALGTTPTSPVTLDALIGRLGDQALVEYIELTDQTLHALVVTGQGASWLPLGPVATVRDLTGRLPFALTRLAGRRGDHGALRALVGDAMARLDTALLRPLAAQLGDRPLIVVPTGPIHSLPWSLLPSCAGRPVTVAPSATAWSSATWTATRPRVVVIAGPGLPGARQEAEAVAAVHRTSALAEASVSDALDRLPGADVAHLATHSRVHPEHPLLSALALADGPLTAYDLERLDPVPRLVVLAGCHTGHHAVRAGDELLGLTASLLARGAVQVIASVLPVPDAETAPLMTAFHKGLVVGRSAAEALAWAQSQQGDDETVAGTAGFVSIGGTFRLNRKGP